MNHPANRLSSRDGVFLTGSVEVNSATPTKRQLRKETANRRFTLLALSISLVFALGCIALIIGTGSAHAAELPAASVANALAVKQQPELGWAAGGSIAVIALGAIFALTGKQKRKA